MDKTKVTELAILVGLDSPSLGAEETSDYASLDELASLVETAGGECAAKVLQRRDTPDPAYFIGEGKAEEVRLLADTFEAELIIFDNELSPSQIRNLEKITGHTVLDRSALILDIFAQRAHTSEGRLQVELAQYRYVLSKLSGMGRSMSRLGGGIGTRGPGESQLETDRRHIRRRIERLEDEFDRIKKVRGTQRERRLKNGIPAAAIVGYTNAGKSTLLNALTGAGIHAQNRLFDTLDPTARRFETADGFSLVFIDTVGFIRKLPHSLIEAFKATLEELAYADVIIHVIDASDPAWEMQAEVTENLINELGAGGTPRIRVFNKCDLVDIVPLRAGDVAISARDGKGLDELIGAIRAIVERSKKRLLLHIPYSEGGALDMLYRDASVKSVEYCDGYIEVDAVCDAETAGRAAKWIAEPQ